MLLMRGVTLQPAFLREPTWGNVPNSLLAANEIIVSENDRASTWQFHLHPDQYWLTVISASIAQSSAVWTCQAGKVMEQCAHSDTLCLHRPCFSAPSWASSTKVVSGPFLALQPPPSPGFSPKYWGLSGLAEPGACSAPAWSYQHTQKPG